MVGAGGVGRGGGAFWGGGWGGDRFCVWAGGRSFAFGEKASTIAMKSRPDVLLGVGGGSNMDLAKVVGTILTHGGNFRDFAGFGNVPGPIMPLVCLPTTAGTGSEVSHAAVLTDTENQMKVSIL